MSGGVAQLVKSALQSPMSYCSRGDLNTMTIEDVSYWIMGFEHAMNMVKDYIEDAETNRGQ